MPTCLIALGANLGDRRQTLDRASRLLAEEPGVRLLKTSRFHETTPIGGPAGQPPFLNGAATLETSLAPEAVLAVLQRIEDQLGRRRTEQWGPRPIDLDLLLYEREVRRTPALVLPHPRMAWRRFVLEPASEIAGTMVHPTIGWSVAQLLAHLNTAHHYVAIAGGTGVRRAFLAGRIAEACSAERVIEQVNRRLWRRFRADPTGHAWQVALECLRRRTRLLTTDAPSWSDRKRPRVSDFWFDELRAFAWTWLPIDHRKRFFAAWQRARARVARPKLVILLDASGPRLRERTLQSGDSPWDCAARAVLEEIAKPNVGPVLRLAEGDPDAMLAEVVAAMESMNR